MNVKPFIAWIEFPEGHNEPYGDLGVYLVNPGERKYENVRMFTGAFEGDSDGLLETSKVVKDLGPLSPQAIRKIDAMTWYDLDFVYWYHLDFFTENNSRPEQYQFSIMKAYAWDEKKIALLPIIEMCGIRIELEPRQGEDISEAVKTIYLESRYTPSAGSDS